MAEAMVIAAAALLMAVVMNLAFVTQRAAGDSGWIDVFWTFGTGAAGALVALWPIDGLPSARQWIAAALIGVWSARLGAYIALRVAKGPEDVRYRRFRAAWGEAYQRTLYRLVMPQALITALLCISILVAAHRTGPLDGRDGLAFAILLIAIAGEALADRQMARFKASKPPKGAICDTGLWAWSRHPNYFFEWLGWCAWPAMALDPSRPVTWLTLIAPAVMYGVLRFMTGVPPLEQAMLESRGDAYRAYQKRTSALIPLPPRMTNFPNV